MSLVQDQHGTVIQFPPKEIPKPGFIVSGKANHFGFSDPFFNSAVIANVCLMIATLALTQVFLWVFFIVMDAAPNGTRIM